MKKLIYRWYALGIAAVLSATAPVAGFEPVPDPLPMMMTHPSGSYLGVAVAELSAERARALSLKEEQGVEITRLEEDSPADKAGLKTGDVVLEYNGQRVEGLEQFMRLVRETPPGREVKLTFSRNAAQQQTVVKTGSRKAWLAARIGENTPEIARIELPDIRIPDVPRAFMSWRSSLLGLETESLDSQLAQYFGVKEGVLVRSVAKGSGAEKAGLKAGDVIVRVEDTKVATPREISTAVRSVRSRKTVSMTAVREKREMSFTVPVEDAGQFNHAVPRFSPSPR